jgi:hypothetical protein
MDNKQKHLEFIQSAIARMASNLFMLKGWAITLIAGLFALAAKDANAIYYIIAYIPALMFWWLDAYFLSLERRFRTLYESVRTLDESQIDFSMNTEPFKKCENNGFWDAFFSWSLSMYYGVLIGTMMVVMFLTKEG